MDITSKGKFNPRDLLKSWLFTLPAQSGLFYAYRKRIGGKVTFVLRFGYRDSPKGGAWRGDPLNGTVVNQGDDVIVAGGWPISGFRI